LHDLLGYSWKNLGLKNDILEELAEQVYEGEFEDYGLRNL